MIILMKLYWNIDMKYVLHFDVCEVAQSADGN